MDLLADQALDLYELVGKRIHAYEQKARDSHLKARPDPIVVYDFEPG